MATTLEVAQAAQADAHGRQLHREFVGMLFALAIAQVAVEGSQIVGSGLSWRMTFASYAHLSLAAAVIATSWVGWGWSKHSLSNVEHVFTKDFLELLLDVWLVIVYFFIVHGVEVPVGEGSAKTIAPSLANEKLWVMVVFITYAGWDFLTKGPVRANQWKFLRDKQGRVVLAERGWASVTCALVAITAYALLPEVSPGLWRVVTGDISLIALVFMFRAMKLADRHRLSTRQWALIGSLATVTFVLLVASAGVVI